MPWFGDKGMPAMPFALGTYYSISVDEFRQASHPIEIITPASALFAVAFGSASPLSNYLSRRPLLMGGPRIFLGAAAGLWLGYYVTRAHSQYYLGKFKYCLEYALNRRDSFPLNVPPKFSDPEKLEHWKPMR